MARLGIVIYHGVEGGAALRDYARGAEEAGFESVWVTERNFHEEAFSLLGFLGAATERIKLGLGVTNPYTRHPALLAMASATGDRMSSGRFLLGLGGSDRFTIQERMGIAYDNPRSTVEETVAALRTLLSGGTLTSTAGRFPMKDAHLAVLPVQQRLPIYLAGTGPKALRMAGAIADGVLLNAFTPTDYVRYATEEVRKGAQEADKEPDAVDIACVLAVRLTDDPEAIWPELKHRIVRLLAEPNVGEILLEKGGFDPSILGQLRALAESNREEAARLVSDDMVRSFYVVGSPADCKERITAYREAGADLPVLLPLPHDFGPVAKYLAD